MTQAGKKIDRGQRKAVLTREQVATLQTAFAGEHPGAEARASREEVLRFTSIPRGLFGVTVKADGDAV